MGRECAWGVYVGRECAWGVYVGRQWEEEILLLSK